MLIHHNLLPTLAKQIPLKHYAKWNRFMGALITEINCNNIISMVEILKVIRSSYSRLYYQIFADSFDIDMHRIQSETCDEQRKRIERSNKSNENKINDGINH